MLDVQRERLQRGWEVLVHVSHLGLLIGTYLEEEETNSLGSELVVKIGVRLPPQARPLPSREDWWVEPAP